MTERIQESLRESKTARWVALAIVSFTMLCGYFLTDAMAPLKGMIEREIGWDSAEYGFFTSGYGWFNVYLFMLILGGIILDKLGVRITGFAATIIMVLGAGVKYWAISTHSLDGITWNFLFLWEMKAQVVVAALGFALFGVGVEVAGITVSKIIVKWFKGKEMALAMGLEMACARMGTFLALFASVPIARTFNSVSSPILFGLVLLCIGVLSFTVYIVMDRKLEASEPELAAGKSEEDSFQPMDIIRIITNKGFWLIAILCVLFYSAVFPFIKYAADLMIQKFGVSEEYAGSIPSLLPIGTLILTPFFGNLYDRKGKGASIMIIGSIMIIAIHGLFAVPFLNHWIIGLVLCMALGVSLSLIPSAMWPSVPKIIPERQLGTAYSLIFFIQNIGLMNVPLLIGKVLTKYCISGQVEVEGKLVNTYDYTYPMLIFMCLGILALIVAIMLKAEDKKKGYGLELPNIK